MGLIKMVLATLTCARTARALATTTDALLAGLAQRKAAFLGPGDDAARTVAVGNRAGDLDSIASALAVAHLTSGVALAQFARRDLALRRDASAALDVAAARDALVFADDVSPAVAARRRDVAIWLTDHNRADHGFPLTGAVAGIVDHHADEGAHAAAERDVDGAAGSCSSLVAERLVAAGAGRSDLGALLLFAIALDCRGFDEKFRGTKYGDRDVAALVRREAIPAKEQKQVAQLAVDVSKHLGGSLAAHDGRLRHDQRQLCCSSSRGRRHLRARARSPGRSRR